MSNSEGNFDQVTTEITCEGDLTSLPTTFSSITKNSMATETKINFIKAEFILPFTKKIFENEDEKQLLFKETVNSIRKALPKDVRDDITILKTIIEKKDGKKLHAVRVLSSLKHEKSLLELQLHGINVREKHISAWGPRLQNRDTFPREVTVQFRNLPHFLLESEILNTVNLPKTKKLSNILKQKLHTEDGGYIYIGTAYYKLLVENETELNSLKVWAEENCTKTFSLQNLDFFCNIPSLLSCNFCLSQNKNSNGHHEKYCIQKRQSMEAMKKHKQDTQNAEQISQNEEAIEPEPEVQELNCPTAENDIANEEQQQSITTNQTKEVEMREETKRK